MFDKLIESNTVEAEFKPRRSYFLVSTVVVGILFLTAVVISIYAGEIGIGNGDLELSELMAPVEMAAMEPQPPQPQRQLQSEQSSQTIRNSNMSRPDESQYVPETISTVPNAGLSRPNFPFTITRGPETEAGSPGGTGRDPGNGGKGTGLAPNSGPKAEQPDDSAPPPVSKPKLVSGGVVNGIATSLPKPQYPAPAVALHLEGKVDVQVTIDESGKVISAKAASGHPILRAAAEKAAWGAKFKPTTLTGVPVKVTGVIVYNFARN